MKQEDIWNDRFEKNEGEINSSFLEKYINYFKNKEISILDLGCGDGNNSLYLYNLGYDVIASDFSIKALEIIKKRNEKIKTSCFDMTKDFPFKNEYFDIIIASLSTHYFTLEETKRIYKRIWNSLKYDGYLIFRVNSTLELIRNKKNDIVGTLEENYYISANGKYKRYFSIDSTKEVLKEFSVVNISEVEFAYLNTMKYAIEGVAKKIKPVE